MICVVEHCGRKAYASGLCRTHHRWWKAGRDINAEPRIHKYTGSCIVDKCERKPRSRKMCELHYNRWKRHGDPRLGAKSDRIEYSDVNGYIWANKGHPLNNTPRSQLLHRLIMEDILGRPLLKGESVHHKNGNRSDNRIENLELWSSSQPSGQRIEDKLAWAYEIIELYGEKRFEG